MKILVITARAPYPIWRGDALRVLWPTRMLSKKHSLTLVAPISQKNNDEMVKQLSDVFSRIELVKIPTYKRIFGVIKNIFNGTPLQNGLFYHKRLAEKAISLLNKERYDLIYIALSRIGEVVLELKKLTNVPPIAFDYIDSLSINMERRAEREFFPLNLLVRCEAKRIERFEKLLLNNVDIAFITSVVDKNRIAHSSNKLLVIPNGVDVEHIPFAPYKKEEATIVFTGTMWYFPNVNAVSWFVKNVWHLIKAQVPTAKFKIVGANPSYEIRKMSKIEGIEVTGYVPSIYEHLFRATLAIAPMQAGSGMQFKLLEAMACGTPLVVTPFALGGINVEENKHLLVANKPEEFAEKVILLIKNPSKALEIAKNAREVVEQEYSWNKVANDIERTLLNLTGK